MNAVEKALTADKVALMFDAIQASQITISFFSRLVGTTRATIYKWRNSPEQGVDKIRFNMAYVTAVRLRHAVKQGRLPLSDKVDRGTKEQTIRQIIRTTIPVED